MSKPRSKLMRWLLFKRGMEPIDDNDFAGGNAVESKRPEHPPEQRTAGSKGAKKRLTFQGYFYLYRYATYTDIPFLITAVIAALLSGACLPALAITFGKFSNNMVMLHVIQNNVERNLTSNNDSDYYCDSISKGFEWKNPRKFVREKTDDFITEFSSWGAVYVGLNIILFVCWSIPAEKQTVRWATEYVKGLLSKDMEWFDEHFGVDASSDVIENICQVRQGIGIQVPVGIGLVSSCFLSALCIIWKGYFSVTFIIIIFTIVPFIGYFQREIDSMSEAQFGTFTRSVAPVIAFAEQVFERIQTVILHNGQKRELYYFKQKQSIHLRLNLWKIVNLSFLNSCMALGINTYLALILWQSLKLVWEDRTCHTIHGFEKFDVEVSFTIFACAMFGMLNIWLVRSIWESCVKARMSGAKIAQIIDSDLAHPANFSGLEDNNSRPTLAKIKGKIEFEDVSFAYPMKKNVPVLKNLSFVIEHGMKVGFVGELGTGLSTVFKLLMQNYVPDSGFIRLDDTDIRMIDQSFYLNKVGYLTHDPLIFNDTIESNIRRGNPKATFEEIMGVCRRAEAHEQILQLMDGYKTVTGEHGENITPQLRVQIALARVLLQHPKVLVLDEPTMTLDWQSSCQIEKVLDQVCKNITTLLIPHRFHFIRNADIIFVISNGKVVEQGNYEDLLSSKGAFCQMINQPDITPGRRLELAKISKIFLGKQILPPFSFPKYHTNIGFPDIMGVTTTQIWLESKLATPTFGEHSFDDEDPLSARARHPHLEVPPAQSTLNEPVPLSKVSSDPGWKKCIIKEDQYFSNPVQAYSSNDEKDVFCCSTVLGLTLSTSLVYVSIGIVASFILGLLTPLYGYFLGKTVEILMESDKEKSMRDCKHFARGLLVLGLFSCVVVFLKTTALEIASRRCFVNIQKRLFTSMLRQEFEWFEQSENNSHALQTRLCRDVAGLKYLVKSFYDSVTHYSVAVCSSMGFAIWLSPKFGFHCLFMIPLSIGATFVDATLLTRIEESRKQKIKMMRSVITELCNKRQSVWPTQLQHDFLNRLTLIIESAYTSRNRTVLMYIRALTFSLSQGGTIFLYTVYILFGRPYILDETVKFYDVIAIGHLLVLEMMKVGVAISMHPTVENAFVCGANILKILRRHPKICLDKGNAKDIRGEIQFRNVHFWFDNFPNVRILNEISFKVKPGKTVAIVGVAGSGKSVCLQLILRLRDAPLGTIEIDGEDIRNLNCVQLRQQIAYLHQEKLFDDRTVREVIAYGDNTRQVDMTEIIEAAQKANIHLLISSLPRGYDTPVGSARLTIGQRRRVYVARVFLKNPKILIIEESCTALDPESERRVLSSLTRLRAGRTCLILAHRIKTVELADSVLVFHQGEIVERGTHGTLMASGAIYRQIYEAQSGKNQLFESTLVRKTIITDETRPRRTESIYSVTGGGSRRHRSQSMPNLTENSSASTLAQQSLSSHDLADKIINNFTNFFGYFR